MQQEEDSLIRGNQKSTIPKTGPNEAYISSSNRSSKFPNPLLDPAQDRRSLQDARLHHHDLLQLRLRRLTARIDARVDHLLQAGFGQVFLLVLKIHDGPLFLGSHEVVELLLDVGVLLWVRGQLPGRKFLDQVPACCAAAPRWPGGCRSLAGGLHVLPALRCAGRPAAE